MPSEDPITLAAHEIRDVIDNINRVWLQGDPQDLRQFFHPDVVVQPPGESPRVYGIEACVSSYAEFRSQARIQRFTPGDAEIDVFGDTAVATYRYEIAYILGDEAFDKTAGELLVLMHGDDGWRIIWRTLLS